MSELKATFRLDLTEFYQDLERIKAALKGIGGIGVSGGSGGGGGGSSALDTMVKQIQRGTAATGALGKELEKATRSLAGGGNMGSLAKMPELLRKKIFEQHPELEKEFTERFSKAAGGTSASVPSTEKSIQKLMKDRATFLKDMTFLMMPLMNPGSVWASLFSTRQTFSALMTETGQRKLGKVGISGFAGAAGVTALLVGASTALGLAFMALKKTVQETFLAYEAARKLYAKSLLSGLGLGLQTQRGLLASIIGVSETEVIKFGAAWAYLNPRIEHASKILAETAVPLTQVSWEWKIFQADLSAFAAKMAADIAPAMMEFIDSLSILLKLLDDHKATLIWNLQNSGLGVANTTTKILANMIYGVTDKEVRAGAARGRGTMPDPQAYMKQLPVSAWERMGLVVGGGGNTTNELIMKSNQYLKVIAQAVTSGVPRASQFGLDPNVANP